MKNYINKSAKRILSLALALVMLAGCLFTANIGVNIKAAAETDSTDPYADWDNVQYWDGELFTGKFSDFDVEEGTGRLIIDTAAKLQFACAATKAEYWREDNVNTFGKSFVIDENVDAFIMQPKEVVDKLGIAAFVEASGAEETRELFEEKFADINATPVNWSTTISGVDNGIFAGNFDGSGVPIYGIYADGAAKNIQNVGFFPMTEGSSTKKGASTDAPVTDTTGTDIKNLVIKNCYFKGFRRVGILSGGGWYNGGGMLVDGCVNVDSCVVANCYVLGQNYISSTDTINNTWLTGEMGLLFGNTNSDPVKLSNSLVYGNETEYDTYTDSNTFTSTKDAFNWLFKSNTNNSVAEGSIKKCVILDAVVNSLKSDNTTYCENVYSNAYTTYKNTVTNIIDHASVKGAHGRFYMTGLGWDSAWWAIENDYPTPFKPSDNYVSVAAKEFAGSGTAEDPYLVYGAKQLDTMVSEGGIRGGVRAHYKVAKDVKEIYLNNAKTKEEAKALYDAGTYNNWLHGTISFEGTFDGNGVTIYGMISSNRGTSGNVGFVSKLGATHTAPNFPDVTTDNTTVTIKNVNFVGAYINSNSLAAVVASSVVGWRETSADGTKYEDGETNNIKPHSYISNVTVRDSSINSTKEHFASDTTSHGSGSAAGILTMDNTPDHVVVSNCLYDGGSCELIDGDSANGRTKTAKAGIVSMATGHNELTIENCVAIDEYVIPMVSGVTYSQYNSKCEYYFNTVYGKYNNEFVKDNYNKLTNYYGIDEGKTSFSMLDMPLLNWGGAWNLVEYDGRIIPMPKTSDKAVDDYSTQLAKQNNGKGAVLPDKTRPGGYKDGTYGMYEAFLGSGTEKDPYIISNALDLARAIACGGKDITTKLYYKLSCDIDVGTSWINTNSVAGKYEYVPFEGHIDGDGHAIYNLYSAGDNAGLIPVIVGGASIKNLHIRNSNIISAKADAGAFFGTYQSDGKVSKVTIEGCSFEGAGVDDGVDYLVGDFSRSTIKNSYAIGAKGTRYYVDYPNITTSAAPKVEDENADFYGEEGVENPVWYKGGADGSTPKLVNRAKAMAEVDVSGKGDNDHGSDDLTALRQKLLGNDAYAYIYGDVSRNGVTNLSDLALLGRQLVGTYNKIADGFWRNAALGNVVIYYGENDNYDFARKLELALEAEFGKDVKKVVVTSNVNNVSYGNKSGGLYVHKNDIYTDGANYYKLSENATTGAITPVKIEDSAVISKYALDGKCQIVVGNIPGKTTDISDVNNYKISVDKKNAEIWLQGGSFTAVEQATVDFINESNPDANKLYEVDSDTLDPEKKARTDISAGKTYYYAWGDEFNDATLNKDKWNYCTMHNETDNASSKTFNNLEVAFPEDFEKLYIMENGKLQIWRGYYGAHNTSYDWGYKNLGTLADKGVSSTTSVDNGFSKTVDSDDTYVSAGKIITNKSMLVKQGYLEMKATYPSDNHAFTCWWLLGHHNIANSTMSDSLFGKVFKLNNEAAYTNSANADLYKWDGITNNLNSSDPRTFKHIRPLSSFEIDIAELMQAYNADADANFTIHKFYRDGVYTNADGKNAIKFIDWDYVTTGTRNAKNMKDGPHYTLTFDKGFTENFSVLGAYKDTVSTNITPIDIDEFLYDSEVPKTGSGYSWDPVKYTTYNGEMIGTHQGAKDSVANPHFSKTEDSVNLDGGQEYIFGVKWDASNPNAIFTFTVTKEGETTPIKTVTLTEDIVYHEDKSGTIDTFLSKITSLETDKQTANQYMYMLIDNVFYTSNANNGNIWGNLMSEESGDTTVMEIDYVRVYQEKRDIVTPDTEAFNNGNHFGY